MYFIFQIIDFVMSISHELDPNWLLTVIDASRLLFELCSVLR